MSRKSHLEDSPKVSAFHSIEVKNIHPPKEFRHLKHPAEPTFISNFKYKQYKIRNKRVNLDSIL